MINFAVSALALMHSACQRSPLSPTAHWPRPQQLTTSVRLPAGAPTNSSPSRHCRAGGAAAKAIMMIALPPLPPQAAQYIGGSIAAGLVSVPFFTPALKEWYPNVRKPTWCPPGRVFAPVWVVLYGGLGYAASLVAASTGANGLRQYALTTFAAHVAINVAWPHIFFGARRITLAAWWNVLLLIAACVNLRAFWRVTPLAGMLMAPYLVWCTFATALNFAISNLNRGDAAADEPLNRGNLLPVAAAADEPLSRGNLLPVSADPRAE